MKKYLLTFVISMSLVNISCNILEYEPDGENFVNRTPPVTPGYLSITLSDEADTLFIWGNTAINYQLYVKDLKAWFVKLYIDSIEAGLSYSNYEIGLNSETFPDGYHTFTLELKVRTNSGSLASGFGQEFFTKTINKTIFIDNRSPDQPLNIETSKEAGSLKVTWKKYDRINFQHYKLYRLIRNKTGGFNEKLLTTVSDKDINEYYDYAFVGDTVRYKIELQALNIILTSDVKTFVHAKPFFREAALDENYNVSLVWSRCDFPSNFEKYVIYLNDYGYGIFVKETTDINDTTCLDQNFGFGYPVNYYVYTYSKNYNFVRDSVISKTEPIAAGTNFYQFIDITYNNSLNSLILNGGKSYKINADTYNVEAETDGNLTVSTDGLRACREQNGLVYEVDPHTLQDIRSLELYKLFNSSNPIHQYKIFLSSPNNYLVTENHVSGGFLFERTTPSLIDIDSLKIIDRPYMEVINSVSGNGKYLLAGYALYKIVNGKVTHNFNVTGSAANYFSFSGDGESFVLAKDKKISYRRCSDNSVIREFSYNYDFQYPSIDPITNNVGCFVWDDGYKYRVYDLNNGTIINEVKIFPLYFGRIYLINNTLFSSSGYLYKLQ